MKSLLLVLLLMCTAPALAVDFWRCQSGPTAGNSTVDVTDFGNRFLVEEFQSPRFSEQKKYEHAFISAAFDSSFAYLKIRNDHGVHFEVHDLAVPPGEGIVLQGLSCVKRV